MKQCLGNHCEAWENIAVMVEESRLYGEKVSSIWTEIWNNVQNYIWQRYSW